MTTVLFCAAAAAAAAAAAILKTTAQNQMHLYYYEPFFQQHKYNHTITRNTPGNIYTPAYTVVVGEYFTMSSTTGTGFDSATRVWRLCGSGGFYVNRPRVNTRMLRVVCVRSKNIIAQFSGAVYAAVCAARVRRIIVHTRNATRDERWTTAMCSFRDVCCWWRCDCWWLFVLLVLCAWKPHILYISYVHTHKYVCTMNTHSRRRRRRRFCWIQTKLSYQNNWADLSVNAVVCK